MKKLGLVLLLLWSHHALCDSVVSDELQKKLNDIQTMKASFKQVVKAKKRVVSNSSGNMALSRPGRFRWHTKSPMEQLVIADGKQLWVYDVELEQVTVKKQQQGLGGTAALFLSGYDDTLTHDFDVSKRRQNNKDYYDLKAKSEKENFQRVKLIFADKELKGLEFYDQLGQHTIVHLSDIKTNPKLQKNLFQFTPPRGVDVVKQ